VQLPDLYVIGVQKSGTSSLAKALVGAAIKNVHGPHNPKELHLFNAPSRLNYSLSLDTKAGLKENRRLMNSWMPSCPTSKIRSPLADLTPDYHRVVPKPADMGKLGGLWRPIDEMNISIPATIRKLYGEEAAKKLQFVMMIREPLAQMQSAWYMAKDMNFTYCRDCRAPNFRMHLNYALKFMRGQTPHFQPWLWTAMYARQLENWLEHFDAAQFYVIPMHEFSKGDNAGICEELVHRLDFKMDCRPSSTGAVSHTWAHEHPPVDEDASPRFRAEFDEMYAPEKSRLVKLLRKAHRQGLSLAGFKDGVANDAAITHWLESKW
jgi:hypothetical protein